MKSAARRRIALAFFVESIQKLLELWFLVASKNRPDFVAASYTDGINLSIGLIVNYFCFAVPVKQDAVQLLRLLRS